MSSVCGAASNANLLQVLLFAFSEAIKIFLARASILSHHLSSKFGETFLKKIAFVSVRGILLKSPPLIKVEGRH